MGRAGTSRGRDGQAIVVTTVVLVLAVALWAAGGWVLWRASIRLSPVPPIYRVAARYGLSPERLASGQRTFAASCAACHGPTGGGVPRLGKPLRNNAFVQSLDDTGLLAFVVAGRLASDDLNTTGVPMPARAGNPTLDDGRLADVVLFLRTLQDPDAPPTAMDAWIVAHDDAAGGAGIGLAGHDAYLAACSACHGASGEGLPSLGKPLATSDFVAHRSDAELIEFVKRGRPIWDAENTTGVDMPPKGGNPALDDEQLAQIVEYIRAIHADTGGR